MSTHELKSAKFLRTKAQEFLGNRKKIQIINEIIKHLDSGTDVPSCLMSLELIFSTLLKEEFMYIEIVPLKPIEKSQENECKMWLKNTYEKFFQRVLDCLENNSNKIQLQGLKTAFTLICNEGKHPLENINSSEMCYVPLNKLKSVLIKILFGNSNNAHLINKYTEYLTYNDILFNTWKLLPSLTQKLSNPNETYILNYLGLLGKMQIQKNSEEKLLCSDGDVSFNFDENVTRKVLNKIWCCVMQWEHTKATHKQVLIVLLENVLKYLEKPLFLTDFLMDSLDIGGPVSLLALQGIFTMIQVHNLDYPDVYKKLYSMFEPEIFHTKYKARLFYLADLFLSSSHLPESLVAAFAKRLARLALIAPPEDIKIICMLVGNLILRHPGLKVLINRIDQKSSNTDPFIMEETSPSKSNAINSSLWELQSLQHHTIPSVAKSARLINSLPSVQWDITEHLDDSSEEIFENEIKVLSKMVVLAFEKPDGMALRRGEAVKRFWNI
ncbi:nucleolar complex protein 4 homolog B [Coccinella septempunctata]|uniref:nucleolar complex protein 4 homolog B n=1 Tax=Coccinella septempunctata TaxID=41139 RepID=UPI001D08AC22|nr:nucleolar complex protein 4 homolog B [Coccinella septempunctata]